MINDSVDCAICSGKESENYHFKDGYLILRCLNCGFIFVEVSDVDFVDYYTNPNYLHDNEGRGYVNYDQDKAAMVSVYVNLFQKIRAYNAGKRLLDLGTASGYFLDIAKRNGYLAEGNDLNPLAVQEGSSRGRKIKQGDLFTIGYLPESFDVVTAFDFFEHLPNNKLKTYLSEIKKLLVRGGVLAIITVNTASLWAKIFGKKWHTWLPPEHISYFSDKNIRKFLEDNGYEVLYLKTIHKKFSLQYIFNFLYRYQKIFIWRWVTLFLERFPKLGTLAVKLPLGDNILVLARLI